MGHDTRYGVRLAIIYAVIWFVDLLDASLLNVALPEISVALRVDPTNAEWVLIGFLLAIVIGMLLSAPASVNFGIRRVFIGSQWLYVISSAACGLSPGFSELVIFRVFQGFGGGLAIPIGMNLIMTALPKDRWAKTGSWMNLFSLLAPALGPILAGYIVSNLDWRWLFFSKLPLSIGAVILSHFWVLHAKNRKKERFDWFGFLFVSSSLSLLLLVFTEIGKDLFSNWTLLILFSLAVVCGLAFVWQEKRVKNPLVPFRIFHSRLFSWGNVVQSAANMIFLGSTFIVALYLQWGVGFDIVETGWIMAAITLGMMAVMPLTARYYNRIGPLPYMIVGLLLMSASMFLLLLVDKKTPIWVIASIIFFEGAGSAGLQTTNFVSIFTEVPQQLKGVGSSVYSLLKQISASFGIALSTLALTLVMNAYGLEKLTTDAPQKIFFGPLIFLGAVPLLALLCCPFIDNKKAIQALAIKEHLETEFEEGTE